MKDLNDFTAAVYAKAAHKKQQTRRAAVTAVVAAVALGSTVAAFALRAPAPSAMPAEEATVQTCTVPQTQHDLLPDPTQEESAGNGTQTAAPQAEAAEETSGTPAATMRAAQTAAEIRSTTVRAAQTAAMTRNAILRETREHGVETEIGMTEIAWEQDLSPASIDETRKQTSTKPLAAQPDTKEIIAAAYAALDADTRKAVDPADALPLAVGGAADGTAYRVMFQTETQTVTVSLNDQLEPLSVKTADRPAVAVSQGYNPGN